MKCAVIKVVNGNFFIHAEALTDNAAKVSYHGLCQSLWNALDVQTACVMIVDENLNMLPGYKEAITHLGDSEE